MEPRVTIVTDLGFGDAGKGSIVDYLARTQNARLVVRHNGGSQAAHNVVTPDGRHHTFSQFGSGSFVPGTRTHLSRFMLVQPLYLMEEAERLARLGLPDILSRLTIDEAAPIITPYHQAANRLRELARGGDRHGSCGHGVGETAADVQLLGDEALRAGDLRYPLPCIKKLESIRLHKLAQLEEIMARVANIPEAASELATLQDDALSMVITDFYSIVAASVAIVSSNELGYLLQATEHTVFEGAQGVLLDEWYGFFPYATRSTTTTDNAFALLEEAAFDDTVTSLGLIRAYATRHGAGPFVTEDEGLTASLTEPHNRHNPWQQNWRAGYFDAVATRYALEVAGPIDGLVVTCLDRLAGQVDWRLANVYDQAGERLNRLLPSPDGRSLDYQRELTASLFKSRPIYDVAQPGSFELEDTMPYVDLLSDLLRRPVVLASAGPAAQHKWPVH